MADNKPPEGWDAAPVAQAASALPANVPVQTTKLDPASETQYQSWKTTLPKGLQYEGDYDLRGFYQKNPKFSVDDPAQHMTDEFKLPNHPTFSNESKYYNDKTKHLGGHWEGNVYVPNDTRYKQRHDEDAEGTADPTVKKSAPPPGWDDAPVVSAEPKESSTADQAQNNMLGIGTQAEEAQKKQTGKAFVSAVTHPVDTIADPSKRRELERGISDATTFGLAQKLGEKVDPTFAATAAPDATNAPGFREAGSIAGTAMPSAVGNAVGKLASAGTKGAIGTAAKIGATGKVGNAAQAVADATKGIRHAATGGGIAGMAFGHGHAGAIPIAIDAAVSAAPTVIRQAEKIAVTMGEMTSKPATKEIAKYAEKLATLGLRAHQIDLAVDRANKDLDNATQ